MRKALPYLMDLVLLCLLGFAFFYLLRKLSSVQSSISSEASEEVIEDLNRWKRSTEVELATLFDRVKSLAGRVDRAKRKETTSQEATDSTPTGALDSGDLEQTELNKILAHRFHGITS